jgi:hypothetical protein
LSVVNLPTLARQALSQAGRDFVGAVLRVSPATRSNLVRLAFETLRSAEAPRWFEGHRRLAQLLSAAQLTAVHAYLFMPADFEEVVSFAGGRGVGGERLDYARVEPTDEELLDDALFARLQERWPLGRLAHVLGLGRKELLRLGRSPKTVRHIL